MTSNSQLNANRENAKLSTGPRTEEGKARSAMNGLLHGFTSGSFVIPEGEQEAFQLLEQGLRQSSKPQGQLEEELFGQILHASWNLRRLQRYETQMLDESPFEDEKRAKNAQLLLRYKNHHDRNFHRATRLLMELQTSRLALKPFPDGDKSMAETAPLANVLRITKNTDIIFRRRREGLFPMPPPSGYRGPGDFPGEPNRRPPRNL
jgi:hypothetical protein